MLGINLMFAGFALSLNGVSYYVKINRKMIAFANLLVGAIIFINSVIGVLQAASIADYSNSAGGFLFAVNYLLIFISHIKEDTFKLFGFYELFAFIVSAIYVVSTAINGIYILTYLWAMWAILWFEGFLDSFCNIKNMDRISPIFLIANGILSTFVPGILILLGIIL